MLSTRPPGPSEDRAQDHLLALRQDPLSLLTGLAREHGDHVRFHLGPQEVYMLSHPDSVKEVLVTHGSRFSKGRGLQKAKFFLGEGLLTSEGAFHIRQRRLAQPAFHRQRVSAYGTVMTQAALRIDEGWQDGVSTDVFEDMLKLTLAVVGKTLFNADVEADAREIGEALEMVMAFFKVATNPFDEGGEKLPLPALRRAKQAKDRLVPLIRRIIEDRSGEDQGDLLSMLLLAREEDGSGMSEQQVFDEAMTLFLSGHETTAIALTWTWYLLSQHPEVEATLQAELQQVLSGRTPTVEDLPRLTYARMVLTEALRLYPPVWLLGRKALEDTPIGPYVVPQGTRVFMSQYVIHRDPRHYPNPERFDPLRWDRDASESRPKFAYFPFGGGSRVCIGEGFFWTEAVLVLATLAQRWRLELEPGHPVVMEPLVTLRPMHGMRMIPQRLVQA